MSATLRYREPYRYSAGLLAMGVHVAFFALLVMGVRWQSHQPDRFSVELWDSLPIQQPAEESAQEAVEPYKELGEAFSKAVEETTPEQEYYIGRSVAAFILSAYPAYDKDMDKDKLNQYLRCVYNVSQG